VSEWKEVKLGDISFFSGERISVDNINTNNYISTDNMKPNKNGVSKAPKLPTSKTVLKYQSNDILVSNIRPYFKKIWFADQDGGSSSDVLIIRNKNEKRLDSRYLYYILFNDDFFAYVMRGAKGAKMPRGDKQEIMKYPISLPSIEIQKNIAKVMCNLDEKIRTNIIINQTLEEMAMILYKHWFVDFGPFQGDEFVESELGMIPEGWRVKKLNEVVNTQYGYTASAEKEDIGPNFLRITDIQEGFINWNGVPYCYIDQANFDKYSLGKGDIVIARTGNSTGQVGYINSEVASVFASFLVRLQPKSINLSSHFLFLLVTASHYQDYLSGAASGTTRKGANAKVMTEYKFSLPPNKVMTKFHRTVDGTLNQIEDNLWENQSLRNIRDYLLPKLLSGEVDLWEAKKQIEETL
jgi:type I restriction enzyme S subunit